jgi:hypothetical protein
MKHSYTLKSVIHPKNRAFLALPVDLKWARVLNAGRAEVLLHFFFHRLFGQPGKQEKKRNGDP